MPCCLDRFRALSGFLAGRDTPWRALGLGASDLLELAASEEIGGVVYDQLSRSAHADGWPAEVREPLAAQARDRAAAELLRSAETRAVVAALVAEGARPILLKGTPLAYSVYRTPGSRPRQDTDVFVREGDVEIARRVLAARGYAATVHCSDLFSQFEMQKLDSYGVRHAFDVHWKVSAQPVFAGMVSHEELRLRAQPIPALGPHAIGPGVADALLLACVHPVMHHRNEARALWMYDIHLLASTLPAVELDRFVERALQKQVAAICLHGLEMAHTMFDTPVPSGVFARLAAAPSEPSAEYLDRDRRWHHELVSSLRGLPTLRGRLGLLRNVLFPSAGYMLAAYGLRGRSHKLLLPLLYLHRDIVGVLKVVTGKK